MAKKKTNKSDKVGYVMLGVAVDYFLFRPVRTLKPFWTFILGFVVGAIYTIGVEKIADVIRTVF
jgi:hypothetical protein